MNKLLLFIKQAKVGDLLIIIFALGVIIYMIIKSWNVPNGKYLKIEMYDNQIKFFSINQSRKQKIPGLLGNSEISIDNGKARFAKSPCSKKYCIHHGWVSKVNQTIVCLPNQIAISITDGNEIYDSINY